MQTPASSSAKPQRVLACVLCQQRKVQRPHIRLSLDLQSNMNVLKPLTDRHVSCMQVKCDRTFPCSNCVKTYAQCVPAILAPRQRRRRFPERELLEVYPYG